MDIRTAKNALAVVIGRLRGELGLSQEEVARAGWCSLGTIKNLETANSDFRLSSLIGVAEGLGIPLVSLLREFVAELEGESERTGVTSVKFLDDETVQVFVREVGLSLRLRMRRPQK